MAQSEISFMDDVSMASAQNSASDDAQELSHEALRQRYSFIPKLMEKVLGRIDPSLEHEALKAHYAYRQKTRKAMFKNGEIPGWRAVVLKRSAHHMRFAGVRDDGIIQQHRVSLDEFKPDASALDIARAIGAQAIKRRDEIGAEYSGDLDLRDEAWISLSPRSAKTRKEANSEAKALAGATLRPLPTLDDTQMRQEGQLFKILSNINTPYQARMHGALSSTIMNALNPEVQRSLRGLAIYEPEAANWLTGASQGKACATKARYRQQAVKAFPLFGKDLADIDPLVGFASYGGPDDGLYAGRRGTLRRVVDEGGDLTAALAHFTGTKQATIKAMQGWSWQRMGRDSMAFVSSLAKSLDMIDINHIPKTKRDMADFRACVDAAHDFKLMRPQDTTTDIVRSIGGRFSSVARDLEGNPSLGIKDMADYIYDKLTMPGLIQYIAANTELGKDVSATIEAVRTDGRIAFSVPFQAMSLRQAIQGCEKFHINHGRYEAELTTRIRQDEWPALLKSQDLADDITAEELHSAPRLKLQSLKENHCVSGYTDNITLGSSVIYSINRAGKILSTVELSPEQDGNGKTSFHIVQNMARENKEPVREAKTAAKRLEKELNALPQEVVSTYFEALRDYRHRKDLSRRNLFDRTADSVGYDPLDRKSLEKSWDTLSPLLTKSDRKLGLDGWIEKAAKTAGLDRETLAASNGKPKPSSSFFWF